MRDKHYMTVTLQSIDSVKLPPPYDGGTTATLEMSEEAGKDGRSHNESVRLRLSKGQVDCTSYSYSTLCTIDARFDGGPVVEFTGRAEDCSDLTCLDILAKAETSDNRRTWPEQIIPGAHKFVIEVPFARNISYQFHFVTDKSLSESVADWKDEVVPSSRPIRTVMNDANENE